VIKPRTPCSNFIHPETKPRLYTRIVNNLTMKKALKITLYGLGAVLLIVLAVLGWVMLTMPNVGPPEDMTIEITPERIERGEYLANHVMLCMDCHAQRDFSLFSGPPVPGTEGAGGEIFDKSMGFPGTFVAKNITPYGIGDWTDGELFRLITTGVKKDGNAIFPVMPYPNYGSIDPEDVKSVIAYIRSLDPIEADHPDSKAAFPMNVILRTMPQKAQFSEMPTEDDRIAFGEYLVKAAVCGDCHTDFKNGKFIGEPLAGGREFVSPDGSIVRSANLTPHENGLGTWTMDQFVQRFKRYADSTYTPEPIAPGDFQSLMPWVMYGGMKESDLEAIYIYLQSLEPVNNEVIRFSKAGM